MMLLPPIRVAPDRREDKSVRNIHESIGWWNHVVMASHAACTFPLGVTFGTENSFNGCGRNIVITVNVDGVTVSVFDMKHAKTCTPIQCMIQNLPENLRHRKAFVLLAALIPGAKKPKTVQPYLEVLMKELRRLYTHGFEAKCPLLKKTVRVRVMLLSTNCDLPAHSDNNEQQGHMATFGCIKCEVKVSDARDEVTFVDICGLFSHFFTNCVFLQGKKVGATM